MLTPEPRKLAPPREVLPYPNGLVRWLLRSPLTLYRLGLGEVLARFRVIILTTRGRKSGLPRHTPIEYRMHGTKIYLISAWGERPNWVQNLMNDPYATVQAGPRTYGTHAQIITDTNEVLRALFLFRKPAPAIYDAILSRLTEHNHVDARTLPELSSQLTVIRLDITNENNKLPGMKTDLVWVWGLIPIAVMGMIIASRIRQNNPQDVE